MENAYTNTIYDVIKIASEKNIKTSYELNVAPYINDLYWVSCYKFALRVLTPKANFSRNVSLNSALCYDTNMVELSHDFAIELYNKFEYFVEKYDNLNKTLEYSSTEKNKRFNRILYTISERFLIDIYRKVSYVDTYDEYDILTGQYHKKEGRSIKSTHNTISLEENQNASADSKEVTLKESHICSSPSAEDVALSRENIMEQLRLYENMPYEFYNYLSLGLYWSNSQLRTLEKKYSRVKIFNGMIRRFSKRYYVPNALKYLDFFTEDQLQYDGAFECSKHISVCRSACKNTLRKHLDNL